MRKRIYEIIEKAEDEDKLSHVYDISMILIIILSLVPLLFKQETTALKIIDKATVSIFIVDYLLRWITADYRFDKKGLFSFIRYPFSFMAIIDLISILPSLSIINSGFKVLRVLRMIRALRVVRVFKAVRYSKNFEIIGNVLRSSKDSLIAVCALA
ncbi:MAG: ion transporter, partial [Lachnospiraceae bacterium]|nr:ion transporter [Lachnospiraceae bacterium]